MIDLSIVIPTYKEEVLLPLLLESIAKQTVKPREVIVADNNSPDRTVEIARNYGATVVKGGNVIEGRNNGFKATNSSVILFLDADVILPSKSFLKDVYNEFVSNKVDVASCFLKLDDAEGRKIKLKTLFTGYNALKLLGKVLRNPLLETGCFLMVKREVFEKIGGFSMDNPGIGEDYEFSKTAVKMGYRYYIIPAKVITSARRFTSKNGTFRAILSGAMLFIIFLLGIYNKKKIMSFVKKVYGKLGG